MMKNENQRRAIVKAEASDLAISTPRGVESKPIDLDAARSILQAVVTIHENSFFEDSDLSRVGIYHIDQVMQALQVVSEDVMNSNNGNFYKLSVVEMLKKPTSHGTLALSVSYELTHTSEQYKKPVNLSMSLLNGKFVLESVIPLRHSDDRFNQNEIRFVDFRRGVRMVSMYDMKQSFSIDKFRYIWRGMRWLIANMLDWDGDLKFPEDLDNRALSKPESPKLLNN